MQAVGQLSIGIYAQLAGAHIATVDRPHQTPDSQHLQQLAKDAHAAAQAYFEGLDIVKFAPKPAAPTE